MDGLSAWSGEPEPIALPFIRPCHYAEAMTRHTAKDFREGGKARLLLDYEGAVYALSMTVGALQDLVYKGRGPVVTKIGRRTFFAVKDLEAFVDAHRQAL
jgi:hypothetical protein